MPTVLIVDDSESVRASVRALFEAEPEFTVAGEAVNGMDAINKADELAPDLIILDLSMPIMNGLEAAEALKSTSPTRRFTSLQPTAGRKWIAPRGPPVWTRYFPKAKTWTR